MKRKTKIILLIIVLLIALIALGFYYLNTYYLPKIIKTKITQEASKILGTDVSLGDIKLNILKGIVLYDLNIQNKRDKTPFLNISRITVNFILPSFFKQGKIIIPVINIDLPTLNIIRYEDNKFNIQDFIPKQTSKEKSTFKIPFLVYKLNIYDSKINFLDRAIQPNIKQTLNLELIKVQLAPLAINFNLYGTLINEKLSTNLKLSGKFQFKTKELEIIAQLDKLDALTYEAYLKDLPFTIKKLLLNNINTECNINLIENSVSVKTDTDVQDAYLLKDDISISSATAKLTTTLNFDLENISSFDYLINIEQLKTNIANPKIPPKTSIEYANLKITPDKLEIKNLELKTLEALVKLNGNLENFSNPIFNINLKSSFDLVPIKEFLKDYVDFADSIIVKGKADIDMKLSKLKDKKDLVFEGFLTLKDAYLKTKDQVYEINAINGIINFDQEKLNWQNLSFFFLDKIFTSKAMISNFKSPQIDLELTSENINLFTKLRPIQKNVFNIELLKGKYLDSNFQASGNLDIQDKNNYYADLDIQSQIEINDLKQIKNLPQEVILKINPQGKFDINGRIRGNLKNPMLLNMSLNISSNELKLYGLRLGYPQLQLIQENQQIKIPQANCSFYGGTISLNGLIDLAKEDFPYALKITADNIVLYKLKDDTPMKDKEFQGMLSANAILSGPGTSLLDVKGQGSFLIKDGYLWEFNPLKKLGDFLFIPRYQTLTFKEARADFYISNKKVSTDNLVLNSDMISLQCEGSIDFSGNLDFEVAPYPISEETESTGEYKDILSEEIAKLAGIAIVQVKGTIQNPKIKLKMVTKQIFDKVKDGVKGTLEKVKGIADVIFGSEE